MLVSKAQLSASSGSAVNGWVRTTVGAAGDTTVLCSACICSLRSSWACLPMVALIRSLWPLTSCWMLCPALEAAVSASRYAWCWALVGTLPFIKAAV